MKGYGKRERNSKKRDGSSGNGSNVRKHCKVICRGVSKMRIEKSLRRTGGPSLSSSTRSRRRGEERRDQHPPTIITMRRCHPWLSGGWMDEWMGGYAARWWFTEGVALLRSSVFSSPGRETPKDRTRGDDFAEGTPRNADDEKLRCVIEWVSYLSNRSVNRCNSHLKVYILYIYFFLHCNLYYIFFFGII